MHQSESPRRLATRSILGFGSMLVPAGVAFAGISGFSIMSATLAPDRFRATIDGTITCPRGKLATIGVQMVQTGPKAAHAWGQTKGVPCTGVATSWRVTVVSQVPMRVGPASALTGAWACVPHGPCEFAHISGDIDLQ